MDGAAEGDYMVLARLREGVDEDAQMVVVISPAESTVAAQLQTLFGLEPSDRLDVEATRDDREMSFTSRQLVEALGYEAVRIQEDALGLMLDTFGTDFPNTATFSAFARARISDVDALTEPDEALLRWMDEEESLYRTLEHHLLTDKFALAETVEKILELSMQTFQRRRARAGRALENHVAEILRLHGVPYDAQARTEGRRQPDFLFPGARAYHDPDFPDELLRMLAVKTTCKDRWRQVLAEADRIARKHLLTLEAPISAGQTAEMDSRSVTLVLPLTLHDLFEPEQQMRLMSIQTFLSSLPRQEK